MQPVDFILAKRNGQEHSREQLHEFLASYLSGDVADYQVAAWLMAVCFQGMTARETADLTTVMAQSGDMLDLSGLPHPVDKHSTGGVGDNTSLVLAPLLAAAGATVAKMSGRGLGHTGGTVDKLESIPGFRSELSDSAFLAQARRIGVVVSGQSRELAPADGLLYALRDATGTVQSLPLIASSVMSKKLASGARSLVLDVKVGSGAFMKSAREAAELARAMMEIGRHAGLNVRAVLSGMEQPLGREIGNASEVMEAARCLRGEGPGDLEELSLVLAEQVLAAAGIPRSQAELAEMLRDGSAWQRFEAWISAQGGDPGAALQLPLAPGRHELRAGNPGVLARLDALRVGQAAGILGGGRQLKGQQIDPGVGITLNVKIGEPVQAGDSLLTVHHRDGRGLEEAVALLRGAVEVADAAAPPALVIETLS
jgi:pyrimidine-nucleoside phosphorylase/thymidine phosphorylase